MCMLIHSAEKRNSFHPLEISAGGVGSGRKSIKFLSVYNAGKSQYPGMKQYHINYLHNGENKYATHTAENVRGAKEALLDHLERTGKIQAGGPGSGRKRNMNENNNHLTRKSPTGFSHNDVVKQYSSNEKKLKGFLDELKNKKYVYQKTVSDSGGGKNHLYKRDDGSRATLLEPSGDQLARGKYNRIIYAGGPGSGRHVEMLQRAKAGAYRLDYFLKNQPSVQVLSVHKENLDPTKLQRIQDWTRESKIQEWQNRGATVVDMPPVDVVRTKTADYLFDGTHRTELATRQGTQVPATVYTIASEGTQANFKLQGKTIYQGLDICIENKAGSIRSGKEPSGKPWLIKMPFDYGYIKSTKGKDGDEVDCFIGPDKAAKFVYIIHQRQNTGDRCSREQAHDKYDEDKIMLGWPTADSAKKAYHSAYTNVDLFTSLTMMTIGEFKIKLEDMRGKKIHASIKAGGPGSGRHKYTSPLKLEWFKKNGFNEYGEKIINDHYSHGNEKYTSLDTYFKPATQEQKNILAKLALDDPANEEKFDKQIKDASVINIPLSKLKYNDDVQEELDSQRLKEYTKGKEDIGRPKLDSSVPLVYKLGNSYVMENGHHRLAVAIIQGKTTANVKVINLDKEINAGGPGSGRHPYGHKAKLPAAARLFKHAQKVEERRIALQHKRRELNKQGLSQRGKPIVSDKAKLALKSMNVATKVQQDVAEKCEVKVTSALGGIKSHDNSPFDIVIGKVGIEVKALINQTNDKITQKGDAIDRKNTYAEANGIKRMYTVAVDYRQSMTKPTVYMRQGVGSFRLGSMIKVAGGFKGLKGVIK